MPLNANTRMTDSNCLLHFRDETQELIIKHYLRKPLNAKMIKYRVLELFKKQIPIEYRSPGARRRFEAECLQLWRRRGFRVPAVMEVPARYSAREPVLALEFIPGERLDHFLAAESRSPEDKIAGLRMVFEEMSTRHCSAIFEEEHRLIHFDANIRNLILNGSEVVHLDFEMGRLGEEIDRSAAREVLKLSLQAAARLGPAQLESIAGLLVNAYGIMHVLQRIIKEVLQPRFRNLHLYRDRKRKEKHAGLLTKVDIARAIGRQIEERAAGRRSAAADPLLRQALETSWNGKYYQSLDDSDPRGRDMHHRYQVMQFPQDFGNASVLDIGCNIGRICLDAKRRGARRAVGLDFRPDVIAAMSECYRSMGIDVELHAFDINEGVEALRARIGDEPFDYIYALSIWSHVDQSKLWAIINYFGAKTLILEDNSPSRIKSLERIRGILETHLDYRSIEFMGFTKDRGIRAVFRLIK